MILPSASQSRSQYVLEIRRHQLFTRKQVFFTLQLSPSKAEPNFHTIKYFCLDYCLMAIFVVSQVFLFYIFRRFRYPRGDNVHGETPQHDETLFQQFGRIHSASKLKRLRTTFSEYSFLLSWSHGWNSSNCCAFWNTMVLIILTWGINRNHGPNNTHSCLNEKPRSQ